MFKPATDLELDQYVAELSYWKKALKNYQPEKVDYFELFKNELPEIIKAKLEELKPEVKNWAEVLLMAEERMKTIKHWFPKMIFKVMVYDVANERFQRAYKEQKRFYWLDRRLNGSTYSPKLTAGEFKEANPVRDTIERYVPINSRGFAKCPFHKDDHASLKIYEKQNRWHCFGACGEGGDTISFLMKIHNKTFNEVLNNEIS